MSKVGALLSTLAAGGAWAMPSDLFYVGTYSNIIASYTNSSGFGQTQAGIAPSWLAFSPAADHMFAVDEFASGGVVRSFRIASDGALFPINSVSNVGEAPCHLEVHPSGRFVVSSNYCGGSVTVIPVSTEGVLGSPSDRILYPGNPANCGGAHAHQAIFDPFGQFALVADLGNDMVFGYKFDSTLGRMIEVSRLNQPRGSGPRHIALHISGKYAYIINELDSTITAARYDEGILSSFQTQSTLRIGETASGMAGAEVVVSANGKFVYCSNRDLTDQRRDSIVVFAVDDSTGGLTPIQHVWTGGQHPRHFGLSPSQKVLKVANKNGRNIVSFDVDTVSGLLSMTSTLSVYFEPTQVLFPDVYAQ